MHLLLRRKRCYAGHSHSWTNCDAIPNFFDTTFFDNGFLYRMTEIGSFLGTAAFYLTGMGFGFG